MGLKRQSYALRLRGRDLPDGRNGAQLPTERVYTWRVIASNAEVGRSTEVAGTKSYASQDADPMVRYVSPDGADDNDGLTISRAKATIQSAVDVLGADGGTVYVMDGDYALDSGVKKYEDVLCGFVVTNPVAIIGRSHDASKVRITVTGGARTASSTSAASNSTRADCPSSSGDERKKGDARWRMRIC